MRSYRTARPIVLLVIALAVLAPLAAPALIAPFAATAAAQAVDPAPRTATRETVDGVGVKRTVSMTVDKTTELQGRERVGVTWRGAQPTANPGAGELQREFPMVLMQCRGVDTATNPIDRRTCFLVSSLRGDANNAQFDALAPAAGDPGGRDVPWAKQVASQPCKGKDGQPVSTEFGAGTKLPYIGADGTLYRFCDNEFGPQYNPGSTPPDLTGGATVLRTQSYAASTGPDGTGTYRFETRTKDEHASLGCSATVPCSLVAVPVMQLTCNSTYPDKFAQCAKGSTSAGGTQPENTLLAKSQWWQESNWRNHLSIPLQFLPTADQCPLSDPRPQLNLDGSELIAGAMAQWLPGFCLDSTSTYRLSYAPGGDGLARRNLTGGQINAALSTRPVQSADPPVVNAPVAVSGFVVSFVLESTVFGEKTTEVRELNLTPRLLAKLLTQSYPGDDGYATANLKHPQLAANPAKLNRDNEFLAVNPGYRAAPGDKQDFPYISLVSVDSDVIYELTRYITSDAKARAWLAGAPDENGMIINPAFSVLSWPSGQIELRDTTAEVKNDNHTCSQEGVPWLTRLMNPLQSLRETGLSVVDSKPTQTIGCTLPTAVPPNAPVGREVQPDGFRATLAISSAADAALYQLDTAGLQVGAAPDGRPVFVKPSPASMRTALDTMEVDPTTKTLRVDHAKLTAASYPGTMVINTAVRTAGLDAAVAARYGDFLDRAAGPLQSPGTKVGNLPAGYVPLPQPMADVTRAAAAAVRAQNGTPAPVTAPPAVSPDLVPAALAQTNPAVPFAPGAGLSGPITTPPGDTGALPGPAPSLGAGPLGSPGVSDAGSPPAAAPTGDIAATATPAPPPASASASPQPTPAAVAATRGEQSTLGRLALPTLLGGGLLIGLLGPVLYLALQPGNPAHTAGAWAYNTLRRR